MGIKRLVTTVLLSRAAAAIAYVGILPVIGAACLALVGHAIGINIVPMIVIGALGGLAVEFIVVIARDR